MTVEAEQTSSDPGHRDEVSGAVVHVLINLVHDLKGDVGVAQALAMAGDSRSFAALADMGAWSSLEEAVALFNAAALVSGDGAVGLHVGEKLLYVPDGSGLVDRFRALGSPAAAFKHIEPLSGHFDATSEAVALEVATDHALIQVLPLSGEGRHAHLCEMTRGLLSQVSALYGRGPALISETECSARGGRYCLYSLSWEEPSTGSGRPRRGVVLGSGRTPARARRIRWEGDGPGPGGRRQGGHRPDGGTPGRAQPDERPDRRCVLDDQPADE